MLSFINSPLQIGSLTIPHRLIQGPLAGYSCAPFRELFNHFTPPAYAVSEMSSAMDILNKHSDQSRYLYRSPQEKLLAYQISGTQEMVMAEAAAKLQDLGADLIDINCGCPKTKIRKKGAGSALLENPELLIGIINKVRAVLHIPLTIKIRIQGNSDDLELARHIAEAGADALIVHGRHWTQDYDVPCDLEQIARIKAAITIPVIANGDIQHAASLERAIRLSACDGFMIARGGSGKPWLYQALLGNRDIVISMEQKISLFMEHLQGLAALENEFKAVLQSKSLVRYYFRNEFRGEQLHVFYGLESLGEIAEFLRVVGI